MKNFKLRTRLIILALLVGALPILTISFVTLNASTAELEDAVLKSNSVFSTLTQENLNTFFDDVLSNGNVLANSDTLQRSIKTLTNEKSTTFDKNLAYAGIQTLMSTAAEEYQFTDIFVTDDQGTVLYSTNYADIIEGGDLSERDYIQSALKGKQHFSDLFYSDFVDSNIVVLGTPVKFGTVSSTPIGTLNILFTQDVINDTVHDGIERLGESGDSYLVNKDGLLLTETRLGSYTEDAALKATVDTYATQMIKQAIENKDFEFSETELYDDYLGNSVYGSYSVVRMGDKHAGLIIEIDESEAFAGVQLMKTTTYVIAGLAFLIGAVIVTLLSRSITRPMNDLIGHANKVANYDITEDIDGKLLSREDEVGAIANSFQNVITNLRDMIKSIDTSANNLAASSEEMTATATQSSQSAEEVAETIDQLAKGATEQASNTTQGNEMLIELGRLVESDRSNIEKIAGLIDDVNNKVNDGLNIVKVLSEKTEDAGAASMVVMESIDKTNNSSNTIGEASGLIASIAEQTNLLALNAAIEAARAGEHGKGFSVVAEEIRKLAEQSTESTKNIDVMVTSLKSDSQLAVGKMQEAKEIVGEQTVSVGDTSNKYQEIAESMTNVIAILHDIEASSLQIQTRNEAVLNTIQELSAIAEENAASTEQAAAAMQQQTASIIEISDASEDLAQVAQELQTLISQFKL